jgi:hypothetical protein
MTERTLYKCDLTGEEFRDESNLVQFRVTAPSKRGMKLHAKEELVPTIELEDGPRDGGYSVEYRIVFGSVMRSDASNSTSVVESDPINREMEALPHVIGVGRYLKVSAGRNASRTLEVVPLNCVPPELREFAELVGEELDEDIIRQM